ncbi:DUF4253 domain-containing protein [Tsukamurella sp. USMM236]|uniref:DUF4253 domain-containing protein n=1 Tax=Tsukamurella sp. USMM236 TaxID=3081301 RepID=UPI0030178517
MPLSTGAPPARPEPHGRRSRAMSGRRGPDPTPDRLTVAERGSLLLVPVARTADVPAALGWWGATNAQLTGGDVTAVLRSWEDRFGASLVSLGVDTMVLQVARRPTGAERRTVLAAEHFAFCVDNFEGFTLEDYGRALDRSDRWSFWWD